MNGYLASAVLSLQGEVSDLDNDGRILRCRQCITAQKRASRAGHSEAQLPLFVMATE